MEKELVNLLKEIRRHLIGITKAIEKLITSLEKGGEDGKEKYSKKRGEN